MMSENYAERLKHKSPFSGAIILFYLEIYCFQLV